MELRRTVRRRRARGLADPAPALARHLRWTGRAHRRDRLGHRLPRRDQYRRSPDLDPARILDGYDYVGQDRFPDDESGHGTHVASTIAAATDNAAGLTGLAYRASIIPIRVLDDQDAGDVLTIARGIRYAIRRKADLINLSVDFPVETAAADIPEVIDALADARRAGILVISSSGNDGTGSVAYPARAPSALAVGATTARGCRSTFSQRWA